MPRAVFGTGVPLSVRLHVSSFVIHDFFRFVMCESPVQLGVGSDTVVSAWANGVVIDPYDNILVSGSIAVGMDQSGTYAFLSRYQFYPNESTNSTLLWRVPIDTLYRLQADIVTMLHPTQPTVGYVVGRMTDDNSPRLSYTFVARFSTTDLTGAQCEVLGTLMGTGDGHSDDPVDAVMLNGYIYVFVNSDGYTPLQFNRGVFFNQLPYTPYTVYFRGRWDLGLLKIDVTSRPHHASVVDMSLYGGFSGDLAFALSMFSGDGANSNPLAVMIGGTSLPWVDDASCAITSNIRPIILTNDRCVLFRAGEYCYNASTNGCAFRECQYAAPCPAGYTCPGNGVAFENCPSNATALVCAPPFAVYMLDPTATITCNCPFSPPPEPDPQQSSGKSWVAYVVIFSVAAFVIGCVAGVCVYLLWGSQHRVIRYGAMLDSSAQTPQAASVTLQA